MSDTPFSLDTLVSVPKYAYPGSFLPKIDDKSGYDHILLATSSQELFGLEREGCFVGTTIPFDCKNSPFIYQTTGMASTHFFERKGITCGLYIDGILIGEIMSKHGFCSRSLE